jgi:hypothetical protein
MRNDNSSEGHEREVLDEKARRAGTRHMILGFLTLLLLLFLVSWCSLP